MSPALTGAAVVGILVGEAVVGVEVVGEAVVGVEEVGALVSARVPLVHEQDEEGQ